MSNYDTHAGRDLDDVTLSFIPAEPGTRLVTAGYDENDSAEPVYFAVGRVIAWEVQSTAQTASRDDVPRAEYAIPVTVGEQGHRIFSMSHEHAILFADGRVEGIDGGEWDSLDAWKRWAAERLAQRAATELIERSERERIERRALEASEQ